MADPSRGHKYQLGVTAYLASLLSKDTTVQDYHIFYEIKELRPFDDIVLAVQYNDSEDFRLYLIQAKCGRIKLNKNYLKAYQQITKKKQWRCLAKAGKISEQHVQFWYFGCQDFRLQPVPFQNGEDFGIRTRTFFDKGPIINSNVYEFFSENDEITRKYQSFFKDFYIFLKQVNTATITTRLKGMWALNDAGPVIEYLDKYFNKNKRGSLSKTDFEHELLRIRLWDSIVKPTKITSYQKESALAWNDLTLSYNVTVVKNESDIETCLFGCISRSIEEKITVEQWNACIDNDGKLSKEIKDEFSTSSIKPETLKDLLTYYWTCGKIPLVLKSDSSLPQLKVFLNLNQHYIIIDPNPDKRYNEMESYKLTAIKNLGNRTAVALLESVLVSMQGRQPTSLYTVINGNELLMQTLTCSDILKLMEPRQVYISEDCLEEHNYRLFIIETSQPEKPINSDDYEPNGDNICIYCNLNGSTEIYKKLKGDITFKNYRIYRLQLENDKLKLNNQTTLDNENSYDPGTFGEDECVQGLENFQIDQYGKNVYSINKGHAVPIIGEVTKMNCFKYLQRYMRKRITDNSEHGGNGAASSSTEFSETIFPDKDFFKEIDSRICVVTGEAGVGKSTFLQQLVRNCNPHYYVLFCNLVKFQVNMREKTQKLVKDPLNFLWNKQGPLSYNHFLRVLRQDPARLIVILDSFDEVIATCNDEVLKLIRKLNDESCLEKIIIGSRLVTVPLLTNEFAVKITKLEMLSKEYNGYYLENWNLDKNILRNMPAEFKTNPLYLDMLRTIFQTSDITLPVLSRWTLYNRIVDLEIERYSRRTKHNLDDFEKKHILRFHWESALKYIFGNNPVTQKFAQQDQGQFANSVRLGMIKYYDMNKNPVFVHYTFAEFFVMQWLSETSDQESKEIIYKIILKRKRFHIFNIWCEQFPLHKALLDAKYMSSNTEILKTIEKLYRDNKEVLLQRDFFGRTALHTIAFGYFPCDNEYIETIIRYMREEGYDLYSRDNLLHWTWIDYCENFSKLYIRGVSQKFFATHEAYWSYYASMRTSINLDPSIINDSYQMAVNYFLPNVLDKLLLIIYRDNEDFIRFRNMCLSSDITITMLPKYFELDQIHLKPLHLAVIYSNISAVRACITRGDKINVADYFGCTPLYYSVLKQNSEIVKLLLDKSAGELEWTEDSKFSTFQLSLRLENRDITQTLIEVVDSKKFGSVWLCDAIRDGDIEVIALLLKHEIDPNEGRGKYKDEYFDGDILCTQALKVIGQYCYDDNISTKSLDEYLSIANPLQKATQRHPAASHLPLNTAIHAGRTDIVHLLLKKGVNINMANICYDYAHISESRIRECTPLCCAIESWNIELVELLLQYGADGNYLDRNGLTPLVSAINNNGEIYKNYDVRFGNIFSNFLDSGGPYEINHQHSKTFSTYLLVEPAILERRLQMIEFLLRYGVDVNFTAKGNFSPLEIVLESKNWRIVEMLLLYGASPNNLKKWHFTNTLAVLPIEHIKVIELLLKNGADPNFKTAYHVTPLYVAARRRNADMVRLLLKYGASADIITSTHTLVAKAKGNADIDAIIWLLNLDEVCFVGPTFDTAYSVEVLELLQTVENQANFNLATEIETTCHGNNEKYLHKLLLCAADLKSSKGLKFLNAVFELRQPDIDQILLRNLGKWGLQPDNFVVHAANYKNKPMIAILARNGQSVNSIVENDRTVLTSIIKSDMDESIVKFLLDNQADVNFADKCGNTPLMTAIDCWNRCIIKMLLEHEAIVNTEEICGLTPLIAVIFQDNDFIVSLFLENRADVNFACKSGLTPLYASVVNGDIEIIKILLRCGAKTNIETCGNTLLVKSITSGHIKVVEILLCHTPIIPDDFSNRYKTIKDILRNLANINTVDEFGATPIHLATQLGNHDIVKTLLSYNADPNRLDRHGRTALHYAFQINRKDIAEKLLQKGADVNIRDNSNLTPLDYDRTNENLEIIEN